MVAMVAGKTIRNRKRRKSQRVTKRFWLCGDGHSDVAEGLPLISARVAACAAHEAHMILRIIAGDLDA